MEIEGVITHVLKHYDVKIKHLENELDRSRAELDTWHAIQAIHANEAVRKAIAGLTNVRQLFTDGQHMKHILSNEPEDAFTFMGFAMNEIQFYIELSRRV